MLLLRNSTRSDDSDDSPSDPSDPDDEESGFGREELGRLFDSSFPTDGPSYWMPMVESPPPRYRADSPPPPYFEVVLRQPPVRNPRPLSPFGIVSPLINGAPVAPPRRSRSVVPGVHRPLPPIPSGECFPTRRLGTSILNLLFLEPGVTVGGESAMARPCSPVPAQLSDSCSGCGEYVTEFTEFSSTPVPTIFVTPPPEDLQDSVSICPSCCRNAASPTSPSSCPDCE